VKLHEKDFRGSVIEEEIVNGLLDFSITAIEEMNSESHQIIKN
jgi:hypothetical protein